MADESGDEPRAERREYDEAFFLDLAQQGRENWHKWRYDPANPANKYVPVTFALTDFSESPYDKIDFSGFEFGDAASFLMCKWRGSEQKSDSKTETPGRACFAGAIFGVGADFTDTVFGNGANFTDTKFGNGANFTDAKFGNDASFTDTKFGNGANFTDAKFGNDASFTSAQFGSIADFTGTKFGGIAEFTGAQFGGIAHFAGTKFGGIAEFTGAQFASGVIFSHVAFGGEANFAHTKFGAEVNFTKTIFKNEIGFLGATFDAQASFRVVAFRNASFTFATFCGEAVFSQTKFKGGAANFKFASFGGTVDSESRPPVAFDKTEFHCPVYFEGAALGMLAHFRNVHFKQTANFIGMAEGQWCAHLADVSSIDDNTRATLAAQHKRLWKRIGDGPDRFLSLVLSAVCFDELSKFSGRSFERLSKFSGACFYIPPEFDGTVNLGRVDFTGTQIKFVPPGKPHWTTESLIPNRLRAFRKNVEETKNHDFERDLYIEERKAERGVVWRQRWEELKNEGWKNWPRNARRLIIHLLWILVMGIYWALADYGRSFVRPAVWLIASGFFFYWCYSKILAPLMPKAGLLADKYEHAVGMVALGNAVPFVGPLTIDGEIKRFLFCPGCDDKIPAIPPEGYQLLVVGQNLFSITLVFFIGLALRNYFRIK